MRRNAKVHCGEMKRRGLSGERARIEERASREGEEGGRDEEKSFSVRETAFGSELRMKFQVSANLYDFYRSLGMGVCVWAFF